MYVVVDAAFCATNTTNNVHGFVFVLSRVVHVCVPTLTYISAKTSLGNIYKQAQGYMHYGRAWNDKGQRGGPFSLPEKVSDDFHVFAIEKSANKVDWYVDGYMYQSYNSTDIEGKFTWPFENVSHFIINLAVGGNWPGYPDNSTVFPATLEVDYVRVWDYSQFHTGGIEGATRVAMDGRAGERYCIQGGNLDAANYTWSAPSGATIETADNASDCVRVMFGNESGYVSAKLQTSLCGVEPYSVPVEILNYYGTEFSLIGPGSDDLATYTGSTGTYSANETMVTYQRKLEEVYDHIYVSVPISGPEQYLDGTKKFYLDVYTTTSAPCTRVLLQLEDATVATPDNYPVGRHSRHSAFLEDTVGWQRLQFNLYDIPDTNVALVNQISMLFDSSVQRSDTYYFRNFTSDTVGCSGSACEPLSYPKCRVAAKSEAGACSDGFGNDQSGFNGDTATGPIDCQGAYFC
jgi:Glycosyl hydrolases family 16